MGSKRLSPDEQDAIKHMFAEIEANPEKVSFQESFIDSLRDYFDKNDFLTEKQIEALRKIYARATDI